VHHIQRKIISKLIYADTLGYAQMRPPGVESNHFAYHLEQLLKAGLVVKKDRAYFLTNQGKALADRVSHENMDVRLQPHIVTSVHITNDAGKKLLFKHTFQPYVDRYGAPQGRLHYGETVAEAAARELHEKTGLNGIELAHRGMVYIRTVSAGETISILLAHVFSGSVAGEPELATASVNGTPLWADIADIPADAYMPGFANIQTHLSEGRAGLFFDEIEATI
jgi:8-oxo-dGTP diphosphatase